jgi:nitrile hydratase beta subunit
MNGVHDLGGTDGLGPIVIESNEPVFHSDWERTIVGIYAAMIAAGYFNADQFRYGVELMPAVEYLSSRYYEHYLHTFEYNAMRVGAIDQVALRERMQYFVEHPDAPVPVKENHALVKVIENLCANSDSARREVARAAKYAVGDRVRVINEHPFGHTRRPRYVRGRVGVVDRISGFFVYPDSSAMGQGDDPQWVYNIRFTLSELWGPHYGDPNSAIYIDAFEPYLEHFPVLEVTDGTKEYTP